MPKVLITRVLPDAVLAEIGPIQERAREYEAQPQLVQQIVERGCDRARAVAGQTMDEVRSAMSLHYQAPD